jgi:hypothetical protein
MRSVFSRSICREKVLQQKPPAAGGFTFADKVAAGFLAEMLRRAFPIEPGFGPIADVHFDARDSEQILDDLLLGLKRGTGATRCAISVRSNRQLTKAGFSDDFVRDAWEQWNGADGSPSIAKPTFSA